MFSCLKFLEIHFCFCYICWFLLKVNCFLRCRIVSDYELIFRGAVWESWVASWGCIFLQRGFSLLLPSTIEVFPGTTLFFVFKLKYNFYIVKCTDLRCAVLTNVYIYIITLFKQRLLFIFNVWSTMYRELIQTLNLCEGGVVVTEFLVLFPTFSEHRPRLKSFFAFLCQWQIFLLHCSLRVWALCKNLISNTVLLMCQGFIFFPVLLSKQKSLSFWDEKILQACCSIRHVLLFTSLFIFGSLEISPSFMIP